MESLTQKLFSYVSSNDTNFSDLISNATEEEIDEIIKICPNENLPYLLVPLIQKNYNLQKFEKIVKKVNINFGNLGVSDDKKNINPLFSTCYNKKIEYVKILVDNGADLEKISSKERNSIMYSLMGGDADTFLYLHKKGVKLLNNGCLDGDNYYFTTKNVVNLLTGIMQKYDDLEKKVEKIQKLKELLEEVKQESTQIGIENFCKDLSSSITMCKEDKKDTHTEIKKNTHTEIVSRVSFLLKEVGKKNSKPEKAEVAKLIFDYILVNKWFLKEHLPFKETVYNKLIEFINQFKEDPDLYKIMNPQEYFDKLFLPE